MFKWLKSIFDKSAEDEKREAAMKEAISLFINVDPETRTIEQRSIAISMLIQLIDAKAHMEGHYKKGEFGNVQVDEGQFKDELQAIATLMESLRLSENLRLWANKSAAKLALAYEEDFPHHLVQQGWCALKDSDKEKLLNDLLRQQAECFSTDDITFEPAKVFIDHKMGKEYLGFVLPTSKVTDDDFRVPWAHINGRLLKEHDGCKALSVTMHEGLHTIFKQVARKYHTGEISEGHDLRRDAEILYNKEAHGSVGPIAIPTAYAHDPEEIMVRQITSIFDSVYQAQPDLAPLAFKQSVISP